MTRIENKRMLAIMAALFSILSVELFMRIPKVDQLNDWCTTPYAFSYHLGLHSRYLIGSIFQRLLHPISLNRLYWFICLSTLVLIGLFSFFYAKVIASAPQDASIGVTYWVLLLLASPASIAFLFYWGNYGRMDLYLLGIMFFALSIADKKYLNNLLPLLILGGMAVHQVFIFTYCAVILGAQLYECYRSQFNRSDMIRLILGLTITVIAFLYFQFGTAPLPFDSASQVMHYFNGLSNLPVNEKMIDYEYFRAFSEHFDAFVKPGLFDRMIRGFIVLLLMMPMNYFVWHFWKTAVKKHFIYVPLCLIPLASLPAFALTIDWGRWFAAVYLSAFTFIAYLYRRGDSVAVQFFTQMAQWVQKRPMAAFGIILYFTALNKFEAAAILTFATKIHLVLQQLF